MGKSPGEQDPEGGKDFVNNGIVFCSWLGFRCCYLGAEGLGMVFKGEHQVVNGIRDEWVWKVTGSFFRGAVGRASWDEKSLLFRKGLHQCHDLCCHSLCLRGPFKSCVLKKTIAKVPSCPTSILPRLSAFHHGFGVARAVGMNGILGRRFMVIGDANI